MQIDVLYFGRPRELAGKSREVLSVNDGAHLREVFAKLGLRYGETMANELGRVEGLIVLVNGREYKTLGGLDMPLHDADTVAILPVVTGG